ncbi:MAG: TIGR01212 family radical SAM protein [Candidatus Zhuqueibacterota bacterium]
MKPPIYTFKQFLKERFPWPVRKLPVHTNLGCPHRENRTGAGGCVYCYNPGFSSLSCDLPDVRRQMADGIARSRAAGFTGKFIAYFQTDTNTYAPISRLEPWWREIENHRDDIVGLAVGTRPDCLSGEALALLSELGESTMVWLELGLQSAHDRTLERINRGHDVACFHRAVGQTRRYPHILICAHIILGLPGETPDHMIATIQTINRLNLDGVKMHHLQVVKHTVLADWYAGGNVPVFSEQEYINLLVTLLPHLAAHISVHRLVGDIRQDLLIAPLWEIPKARIIQLVEQRMKAEKKFQGIAMQ